MVAFPNIFSEAIALFNGIETAFTEFGNTLMADTQFTDWLVAFNLDEMAEGKRPDGTEITKEPLPWQHSSRYEPQTIAEKKVKGQVYDRVTLKDTGDFYNAAKAETGNQQIAIVDSDPKTNIIIATWGRVLGVSEANLQQFIEIIRPEFHKFAYKYFS